MNEAECSWITPSERRIEAARLPSWIPIVPDDEPLPAYEDRPSAVVRVPESDGPQASDCPEPEVHDHHPKVLAELHALREARAAWEEEKRQMATELAALRAVVADVGVRLSTTRKVAIAEAERDVVRLSFAIAERVIGRELRADPMLVVGWIREGIAALGDGEGYVVALSPKIAISPEKLGEMLNASNVSVVIDPTLGEHACEIRGGASSVEESLAARLASVLDAMGIE